uniref:Uncharacterized protein n=1 Tax=Panagrolaimus sp. ES5 TaxID=591445 RepID=A0AC34G4I9_9BILA
MRFLWILVIECLREVLCGGSFERLKFKRDTVNNTTKTEKRSSDDSHDHDHHHTIIWILVGILCAIVVLGLCIGIITGIYCFWKKKKGVNTEEKGSKVPQTFANEQIRNSADRKTDNTPFQSKLGQINASANPKKSVKKTVSSIFGSAPKVEPRAPKTSKKRKIKLISTKGRKKNFYMQNDLQQESSIIEEMINSPGPSGVGSKENVINPPGLPTLGSNENMNPSKASLAPLTRTSSNVPLTSGLVSGILPSNNTVLTATNNGGGGKTFETVENNQNKPSAGDGT